MEFFLSSYFPLKEKSIHCYLNQHTIKPNKYIQFSGIAFEMLAYIIIGVWAGYWLDDYFELEFPYFLMALSIISCLGSILNVINRLPKDGEE